MFLGNYLAYRFCLWMTDANTYLWKWRWHMGIFHLNWWPNLHQVLQEHLEAEQGYFFPQNCLVLAGTYLSIKMLRSKQFVSDNLRTSNTRLSWTPTFKLWQSWSIYLWTVILHCCLYEWVVALVGNYLICQMVFLITKYFPGIYSNKFIFMYC